jgi:two-component system response regulator RegA
MGEASARAIRSVLVADDDELLLNAARRTLGRSRKVLTAVNLVEAARLARHEHPDLAIVDLRLGAASGIDLVRELKREHPDLVVVVYSAYLSVSVTVAAMRAGAERVVFKPVPFEQLVQDVERNEEEEPDLGEPPTLARIEWEHIMRVLQECNYNISAAARRLGIYRSSLQRRLAKHAPKN